jgi:hypothetical protein
MKTYCEWCGERMNPFFVDQKFCCRECSSNWHVAERREAIEHYRACGLRPQVPATQREAAE